MSPTEPQNHSEDRRRKMQLDTLTGFLGFFAFIALVQAVINVVQPEPKVWPALLALVLVIAAVMSWRAGRSR
ncbi:hypothetical protein [Corynebacterium sp. A21]|uniref:hypothetical protein n=1 Tax=Corynebacterium sp. A21 TaxID=3457318 RepID=UPI003FD13646